MDDDKKMTADDMFNKILKKEGISPISKNSEEPTMTEFDLAMSAFKMANALLNILISKRLVTPEDALTFLDATSEVIDSQIELDGDGPDED